MATTLRLKPTDTGARQGLPTLFWTGKKWSEQRQQAEEYAERADALKEHGKLLQRERPEGYRTPIAVTE